MATPIQPRVAREPVGLLLAAVALTGTACGGGHASNRSAGKQAPRASLNESATDGSGPREAKAPTASSSPPADATPVAAPTTVTSDDYGPNLPSDSIGAVVLGDIHLSRRAQAAMLTLVGTVFTDDDERLADGGTWTLAKASWSRSRSGTEPWASHFYLTFTQPFPRVAQARWLRRMVNPRNKVGPPDLPDHFLWLLTCRTRCLEVETDGDAADIYRRATGRPHPGLGGTLSRRYREHLERHAHVRGMPSRQAQQSLLALLGTRLELSDDGSDGDCFLSDLRFERGPLTGDGQWIWEYNARLSTRWWGVPLCSDGDVSDLYRRLTGKDHPTLRGATTETYRRRVLR